MSNQQTAEEMERIEIRMVDAIDSLQRGSIDPSIAKMTVMNCMEQHTHQRLSELRGIARSEEVWAKENIPHEQEDKDKEWNRGYARAMKHMAEKIDELTEHNQYDE